MEKYQCPCCGAPYNGRRCRECNYEPFTEEIAHGLHTHKGEPLVISDPAQIAGRRKQSFDDCPDKKILPKWLWAGIIVLFIAALGIGLFRIAADRIPPDDEIAPEETIIRPEDFHSQTVLYDDGGIRVIADWSDGDAGVSDIPVYVRNDSERDIWISSTWDCVNGYMAQYRFFLCSVDAGEELSTRLWIDDFDLENGNIKTIAELSFRLEIDDAREYTVIDESQQITLRAGVEPDFVQPTDDGGTLICRQDGIEVYYTGREGETCEDGLLFFRMENHSGRSVQVCTLETTVNGEPTDLFVFQDLMPDTWSKTDMMLYSLSDIGLENIWDITSLEIVLGIWDGDNGDVLTQSDPIALDIFQ